MSRHLDMHPIRNVTNSINADVTHVVIIIEYNHNLLITKSLFAQQVVSLSKNNEWRWISAVAS